MDRTVPSGSWGRARPTRGPVVTTEVLDQASVPLTIEFADGYYRFPLPPCRVGALDTSRPEVARVLLALTPSTAVTP